MTSDRQLVERLILPGLMQAILRGIREGIGEDGAVLDPIMELLGQALREPLTDCAAGKHGKLARRAARAATSALHALTTGDSNYASQWLATARLIVGLTEDGTIAVAEGSAFDQAWTGMLNLGFGDDAICDDDAADRMAAAMRQRLHADGYFVCPP